MEGCGPTVGVFDSGVGGLTVARAILRAIPGVRLCYFADTAHVPYGPRPLTQICDFAVQIIEFLFAQGVDAVVLGCNMSSAAGAYAAATERIARPIFDIIQPGCRAACTASTIGKIGVIATQGTVNSGVYGHTLRTMGINAIFEQACPAFVPLVENGQLDGAAVETAVMDYLTPLCAEGVDTLIFGCSHYPYLREVIQRFMGDGVRLIDPAEFVAREVAEHFHTSTDDATDPSRHRFYCSGDPHSLRREGERFLGLPLLNVEQVNVPTERVKGEE